MNNESYTILQSQLEALTGKVNTLTDSVNSSVRKLTQSIEDTNSQLGQDNFSNKRVENKQLILNNALIVGDHDNVAMMSVINGDWRIWAGKADPATAPFRVDKYGNVTATSITLSGYTTSAQVTTIIGNTVTTGYVNALGVTASYVTASIAISSPTITGGTISIGSGNSIFKADSNGIYLGNATFGSAPFRVNMSGQVTASSLTLTNASVGAGSTWGGNEIGVTYIPNLNASKITAGTITIGGTNQPSNLTIVESTSGSAGSTTSLLNWKSSGGTLRGKMWADSSGYMGYNSIGGRHYFYTNNNEYAVFQNGAQAIFNEGISCRDSFNITAGNDARIAGGMFYFASSGTTEAIFANAGVSMEYNANTYHYWNIGGSNELKLSSTGLTLQGYLYQPNSEYIYLGTHYLNLNGSNKTAIIPTSEGYKALYATESPEVWFMDFTTDKNKLDPLFKEVTVSPYHFVQCVDGEYQVWGKRKGHDGFRFEQKSEAEFEANEKFLTSNRPNLLSKVVL